MATLQELLESRRSILIEQRSRCRDTSDKEISKLIWRVWAELATARGHLGESHPVLADRIIDKAQTMLDSIMGSLAESSTTPTSAKSTTADSAGN